VPRMPMRRRGKLFHLRQTRCVAGIGIRISARTKNPSFSPGDSLPILVIKPLERLGQSILTTVDHHQRAVEFRDCRSIRRKLLHFKLPVQMCLGGADSLRSLRTGCRLRYCSATHSCWTMAAPALGTGGQIRGGDLASSSAAIRLLITAANGR